MNFPTIKTQRLLLRQITSADLQNIYNGLSNPAITKYYGVSYDSLEATKGQIKWFEDLEKNETGIWWAICSLDNQTFYGGGGFNDLNKKHKKAEIGFWLLPEFWGQGMMQEAFPMICKYGFEKLQLNRIEAYVFNENQNCKRAIEKLNFTLEGTLRECEISEGRYLDEDIYAMLKSDI